MKIHPIFTHNALQNIFYILEYWENKALIIDPCDSNLAREFLDRNSLSLEKILITHEHFDHYEWVTWLACSKVYAGSIAAQNMPITVTHIFEDREIIFQTEGISMKAILSPGHAAGHMMFELSVNGKVYALFSWDVLFQGGVWHTRGWSNEDLYESIQIFQQYRDDVMIYSWHDYIKNNYDFAKKYAPDTSEKFQKILAQRENENFFTNLWQEREYNPFINATKQEFIELRNLRNNF